MRGDIVRSPPLKVAWFSYFPIEWMPDLPAELQGLPKLHPATWQRVLWEQFKSNANLRLHIIVLRSHFRKSHSFEREGTSFHCIRTPPGLRAASLYWLDTLIISRKLRLIRPDLVHAWGTEFGAAAIATRLRYPALVTMQGILTWYGSVFPLNRHARIGRFLEDRSLPKVRLATTESSFGMRYLQDRYPTLKLLQVEHAPNPIYSTIQRAPQTRPPRLVCVGAFQYSKGPDILLKALDGLPASVAFELCWIGSRDERFEEAIRADTTPELWSRVAFKHDLSPQQIVDEFRTATILLHGARADNSPNSVKEAVVAGLPVVGPRTGGIPDYVFPEKNGLLFESGNINDCRKKIRQALTHTLFSRGEVDPATLQQVRTYLSAETMAQKFYRGYELALEEFRR